MMLLLAACQQSNYIDDLSDTSFVLIDADGNQVAFPDDFEGKIVLAGFIYTYCPDICPMTTANMRVVREQMQNPSDVQFVTLTFDPERDTPEVMARYREAYGLTDTDWKFLTGEPDVIERLMQRMRVRVETSSSETTADGEAVYFLNHTDQISLIDQQGRVVFNYGGSMTPPDIFVEDIQKLR